MVVIFPAAVLRRAGMGVGGGMAPGFLPIMRGVLFIMRNFLLVVRSPGMVISNLGMVANDLFRTGSLRQNGRRGPRCARQQQAPPQ